MRRIALAATIGLVAAILAAPGAAYAATDDSFTVVNPNSCASIEFVDYGPGAAGGGNNDDYVVIHDFCSDGHGVVAWVTVNDGSNLVKYNGNGVAGAPVVWDPFKALGTNDVVAGDLIRLKVCLADGITDEAGFNCRSGSRRSVDG